FHIALASAAKASSQVAAGQSMLVDQSAAHGAAGKVYVSWFPLFEALMKPSTGLPEVERVTEKMPEESLVVCAIIVLGASKTVMVTLGTIIVPEEVRSTVWPDNVIIGGAE